jgi:hypothetical protein
MKRCLILLFAFSLAGCNSGQQQQQLARCASDAESVYPDGTWLAGDDRQSYVWLCMAAHGYQLNRGQGACAASNPTPDVALYAQCYQPSAKTSALLYRMEQALGR